jgi:small conductance mechanosensitive channel
MENDSIIEQLEETIKDESTIENMADAIREISSTPFSVWFPELIKTYVVPLAVKIVIALIVLFVGRWLIKVIKKGLSKMMMRRNADPSLNSFIMSLVSVLLTFFLILSIVGILGVNTSSLVALLASAGLAIGMALSGTLQNFAGGVMIMLFRPFKVGDFISAQGFEGKVSEIQIFNTHLLTVDNKEVILPNGGLSTGVMTNFSKQDIRRVDWVFSMAYGDDYDHAKEVLKRLCAADPKIKKDPEPFIELLKLNDSSVDITVRVWVDGADYWPVFFAMNERVYKAFAAENLHIPFPQMDVHLKQS